VASVQGLNVLFLSASLPRSASEGVDAVLVRRASELQRHCQVVAVAPTPCAPAPLAWINPRWAAYARTPRWQLLEGVPVFYPRYLQFPGAWFAAPAALLMALGASRLIARLKQDGRCDIIFAQSTFPDGLAGALLGRWFRLPLACLGRGTDINVFGHRTRLGRFLTAWIVRNAVGVSVVAHDLARSLETIVAMPEPPVVLYDGIDLDQFFPRDRIPARRRLRLAESSPTILYVGRLVEGKGLPELVEAFADVRARLRDAALVLVGAGPLHHDLRERAQRLGVLPFVKLVGERPYREIPEWLCAADCLALPSETEGFPNIVREALACGRPVVATPVGDIPRVVSAQVGRLVPARDAAALARALVETLTYAWNAEVIRSIVSSMTWERNADETHAFLRRAVALRDR